MVQRTGMANPTQRTARLIRRDLRQVHTVQFVAAIGSVFPRIVGQLDAVGSGRNPRTVFRASAPVLPAKIFGGKPATRR